MGHFGEPGWLSLVVGWGTLVTPFGWVYFGRVIGRVVWYGSWFLVPGCRVQGGGPIGF